MDSDDKAILTIIATVLFSLFASITAVWGLHTHAYQVKTVECIHATISPDLCNKY